MAYSKKVLEDLVQCENQIGFDALAAKQSAQVASDVALVREAKQIEKVGIDLHVFNVIKALRQEEDVKLPHGRAVRVFAWYMRKVKHYTSANSSFTASSSSSSSSDVDAEFHFSVKPSANLQSSASEIT